ncbi:MAG: hypothetical protein WAV85_12185, partial [Rhodoferax sp.]
QLGEALDDDILIEISLISREAAWQMRALARQALSHWSLTADEAYPPALIAWMTATDQLAENVEPVAPAGV